MAVYNTVYSKPTITATITTITACQFLATKPPQGGILYMWKLTPPGLWFRGGWHFSESDWATSSQNPSFRRSRNLHQAVPWHCRLTNGSSTFQFLYGGRSVGLRVETLDNRWATKRISVYILARAPITACRWIRDKSLTLEKTFYACGSGAVGSFFAKTVGPLLREIF